MRVCPFCEGEAVIKPNYDMRISYRVVCKACKASTDDKNVRAEAIEAWDKGIVYRDVEE